MSKHPKKVKLDRGWLSTNIGISSASNPMRPRSVEQQAAKETLHKQLLLLQQRNKADNAPNLDGAQFTAYSTDMSNDELDRNFESTNDKFIPTADALPNPDLEFDESDYETDSVTHDGDSLESQAFYKAYFGLPPALKSQPTMYAANMRETMQGFQSIKKACVVIWMYKADNATVLPLQDALPVDQFCWSLLTMQIMPNYMLITLLIYLTGRMREQNKFQCVNDSIQRVNDTNPNDSNPSPFCGNCPYTNGSLLKRTNTPPETSASAPIDSVETPSALQTLFKVPFNVLTKEFRNQQAQYTQEIIIAADDTNSFKQQLWTVIFQQIKRAVLFEGDSCKWAPIHKHELTLADIDNYAVICSLTGNRGIQISTLDSAKIQSMHGKVHAVWIFQYSGVVVTAPMFKTVKKHLLDPAVSDRSGAPAESEHLAMVAQLKDHHSANYQSYDINWRIWANYVLAGDAIADTNHAVANRSLAHGHRVALESNGRFAGQINQLIEVYRGVKRTMERAFENALEDATEVFEARIHAIREDIRSREEMLIAMC
ncbi:hypothetical protein BJ741DRAFT_655729 [Chytriomyces cf. hyalinus JEL632]|nr:hypothetical protein BJ741DRAFT_655729 [Chytriomyces cf. hyalinus JEL632]